MRVIISRIGSSFGGSLCSLRLSQAAASDRRNNSDCFPISAPSIALADQTHFALAFNRRKPAMPFAMRAWCCNPVGFPLFILIEKLDQRRDNALIGSEIEII